jgi:hypothetical protein
MVEKEKIAFHFEMKAEAPLITIHLNPGSPAVFVSGSNVGLVHPKLGRLTEELKRAVSAGDIHGKFEYAAKRLAGEFPDDALGLAALGRVIGLFGEWVAISRLYWSQDMGHYFLVSGR